MHLSSLLSLVEDRPEYRRLLGTLGPAGTVRLALLEAAKPYVLARLQKDLPVPLLVITARPETARRWEDQIVAWSEKADAVHLFPEPDALPYEPLTSDPSTIQQRLRVLQTLAEASIPALVVTCAQALMQKTFAPADLRRAVHVLRRGQQVDLADLLGRWVEMGYRHESLVEMPGTFNRRGGIVDVYSPANDLPVRIELLDDEIASLRLFDPATQRSSQIVNQVTIGPASEGTETEERRWGGEEIGATPESGAPSVPSGCLLDYLSRSAVLVLDEPEAVEATVRDLEAQAEELGRGRIERGELAEDYPVPYFTWDELAPRLAAAKRRLEVRYSEVPEPTDPASTQPVAGERDVAGSGEVAEIRLPFQPAPTYGGRLRALQDDLASRSPGDGQVAIVSQQAERLAELLEGYSPLLVHGSLAEGWILGEGGDRFLLLTDAEVFGISKPRRVIRRRAVSREAQLSDLTPGEYVVHIEHGIARFVGMVHRQVDGVQREYLLLNYAEGDQLFVPADQVDRVSRYVGAGEHTPALHRLGTQDWARAKERVRRSVKNIAAELLNLYSARQVVNGHAFPTDSAWQREMEGGFPYLETPDQLEAITAVKQDMERPLPMDRLICGDVGYGKTEVALRAAFKAVMGGRQVAVLVPTTVLAQQHFRTFSDRLASFPVVIEMLSRFRSDREQRAAIAALGEGRVDICIGTHRLLQKDVQFKDLGLLIVDEEQRFGVTHKEKLKQMRREVDVLTLTATPIPRTLHMSMVGIRDMTTMETAPEDRLPIKTFVTPYDDRLVREVMLRELDRGGQVFFVHNRVHNIEQVAYRLRLLVPEAKVVVGHGQMPEEQLERVMLDFAAGKGDVLVCTTIIESGLDIPNVNTLIINHADQFGLAQLYQLRGRVGRGANRAYAYFLYERNRVLTETAEKRLRAIFEATELGAGLRIAMKDLEIRGAGNLLGAEQSGHISAVGFDLYCQLLAHAVGEIKGRTSTNGPVRPERRGSLTPAAPALPSIDVPISAFIPPPYVEGTAARLSLYQRLAGLRTPAEVEEMALELKDRFGELPRPVENLLYVVRLRILAGRAGVQSIVQQEGQLVIVLSRPVEDGRGLAAAFGPALRIGTTQVRLSREEGSSTWVAALRQLLEVLAGERTLESIRVRATHPDTRTRRHVVGKTRTWR